MLATPRAWESPRARRLVSAASPLARRFLVWRRPSGGRLDDLRSAGIPVSSVKVMGIRGARSRRRVGARLLTRASPNRGRGEMQSV